MTKSCMENYLVFFVKHKRICKLELKVFYIWVLYIRLAKQMKKRIWKDYEPSAPSVAIDKKEFTGKVLNSSSTFCVINGLVSTTLY